MPLQAGSDVHKPVFVLSLLIGLLSASGGKPCWADDWGYEQPHEVKPAKAVALPLKATPARAVPGKTLAAAPRTVPPQVKPHAAPKTVAPGAPTNVGSTKTDYATECWNQLYQIASREEAD